MYHAKSVTQYSNKRMGNNGSAKTLIRAETVTLKTFSLANIVTSIHLRQENGEIFVGTARGSVYLFARDSLDVGKHN